MSFLEKVMKGKVGLDRVKKGKERIENGIRRNSIPEGVTHTMDGQGSFRDIVKRFGLASYIKSKYQLLKIVWGAHGK